MQRDLDRKRSRALRGTGDFVSPVARAAELVRASEGIRHSAIRWRVWIGGFG
jgi:hypothetical protein